MKWCEANGIMKIAAVITLCCSVALLTGCPVVGPEGPEGPEGPSGLQAAVGPGLNVTIDGVVIPADMMAELTFTATDDTGAIVTLDQFTGDRDVRFAFAYLEGSGAAKATPTGSFFSYVTNAENGQASYDHHLSAGLSENEDGSITYKFEAMVAKAYDPSATHQVAGQLTRTNPLDGARFLANAVYTFRPDGGTVTETREISTTDVCNQCHTRLQLHGSRRELQYCILCHTPQSVDPDTGNSVDMPELIHKIHMGEHLPSVQAGTPYQIIGYRSSVHDYSTVVFPQDVRNCTVCHQGGAHADAYLNNPTAAGCGACHDDVNLETGDGHVGGPHANDDLCSICHTPANIADAHMPGGSDVPKLVLAATADGISVDGTGLVSVTFSASDTDGNPILNLDDTDQYRAGVLIGWPASEYLDNVGDSNIGDELTNHGDGTYTFTTAAGDEIPLGTADTFGLVFRGRRHLDLNGDAGDPEGDDYETRQPMAAPTPVFFRTDGGAATARRDIVDDQKCAACHGEPFAGHGSDRIGVAVCVVCHNPNLTSTPDDPESPTVTVNMKDMIHAIHTGEELMSGYTTGGHGGDVDFTHIRFPGDRRQCTICHLEGTYGVPLPDEAVATMVDDGTTVTEVLPERAACTSCHDSLMANVHAILMADPATGFETCGICHGDGAEADIEAAHDMGP